MKRNWTLTSLSLVLFLVACGGQPGGTGPPAPAIARIEVTPAALLLTQPGETAQLTAHAYDAEGNILEANFTWTSLRPDTVSVSAQGEVTARAGLGSAQLVVEAGGTRAPPVVVLLAQPAPGALLVSDEQVVGEPEAVDEEAEYGLGWRYRVTLTGLAAPEVGDIVVGTGETALGGRVVAVAPAGNNLMVTLELIPLEELFETLVIDESLSLDNARFSLSEEIAEAFTVTRTGAGALRFESRLGVSLHGEPDSGGMSPQALAEFDLGPFKCKLIAGVNLPLLLTGTVALELNPQLSYIVSYDGVDDGLKELGLKGTVEAKVVAKPRLGAEFEGKGECSATLTSLTLPLGGPLALLFGGQVPLGVGFELRGKTAVANVGAKLGVEAKASVEIGIHKLDTGWQMYNEFETDGHASFEWLLPDPSEQFRVELRLYGFGFAKLNIGNPFLQSLQFETFDLRAGLAQVVDLAPMSVQVNDTGYRSHYQLALLGQAKAGAKIEALMNLLQITFVKVELELELPLAESPKGSFTISPDTVQAGNNSQLGDMATFTVTLDSVTYLGAYVVEGIDIYWLKDGELANGRPGCTSMTASANQTTFSCQADFLEEHEGEQTFYAFVRASLFGVSLPVPLEVSTDAKATVGVGEVGCPETSLVTAQSDQCPAPTLSYTFDNDLEGWLTGTGAQALDSARWHGDIGNPPGSVELDGSDFGNPDGEANAWLYKTLELPVGATLLRFETRANAEAGTDGALRVRLVDGGGASHTLLDWEVLAGETWVPRSADIAAFAGQIVILYFEQGDNDIGIGEYRYIDNIAIE